MSFKDIFLVWSSAALLLSGVKPFVQFSRGVMRNNSMKLFLIWTNRSGGDVF